MADKKASQSQQTIPNIPGTETWKKMVDEHVERMETVLEQSASFEAKSLEQARTAVEESARLFQDMLTFSAQISSEWRKLAIEATRKSMAGARG